MIDINTVDWNQVWRERRAARTARARDEQFWNQRAPSFAKAAAETGFAEEFLAIMKPRPHWRVLDMACGGGTLAIPLAGQVASITAVDFSSRMLAILEEQCREKAITNIRTIRGRWEDDWEELGIGLHDVAIASRALVSDDLHGSILKLDRIARERVYLVSTVGDGPYDRRMFEAIGRPLDSGPDYIYVYNLLYQMGIFAEITFILNPNDKTFASPDEALHSSLWMFGSLDRREEELLRSFLAKKLVDCGGRWALPYPRMVRWAVISWPKRYA